MLHNDTTYLKCQEDAQCYRNGGHSDYSFVKSIAAPSSGISLLQKCITPYRTGGCAGQAYSIDYAGI